VLFINVVFIYALLARGGLEEEGRVKRGRRGKERKSHLWALGPSSLPGFSFTT